jgi:hypothetical protein
MGLHWITKKSRLYYFSVDGGDLYWYCLVQYYFKGGCEHRIEHKPHGNSKRNQEYVRMRQSTKEALEKASMCKHPRDAIHYVVEESIGSVTSCTGLGQMPKNR